MLKRLFAQTGFFRQNAQLPSGLFLAKFYIMEEVIAQIRKNILNTLALLASEEEQLAYERNVPHVASLAPSLFR